MAILQAAYAIPAAVVGLWRDTSVLLLRHSDVARHDVQWADIDQLSDNTVQHVRAEVEAIPRGPLFSAFGWVSMS